jgi:hypothetical protein
MPILAARRNEIPAAISARIHCFDYLLFLVAHCGLLFMGVDIFRRYDLAD